MAFFDSDDEIEPEMLQAIATAIERDEPDVIRSNFSVFSFGVSKPQIMDHPYNILLDRQYIIDQVVPYLIGIKENECRNHMSHVTLFYKRSILVEHNLCYDERQKKEEDHPFIAKALAYSNTIEFLEPTFYHYLKHDGSLISKYSPRFENICINFRLYEKLFSEYYVFSSKTKITYNTSVPLSLKMA